MTRFGSIRRHTSYLWYVIRHKWFVLMASIKIGASIWLAVIHDLSKFKPSEWFSYAFTFYRPDGSSRYLEGSSFAYAWNAHQKSNKHHWQYWVISWDNGKVEALSMPVKYIKEMVADWMGACRVQTGKWEVYDWYMKNKNKMNLHSHTDVFVCYLLRMSAIRR